MNSHCQKTSRKYAFSKYFTGQSPCNSSSKQRDNGTFWWWNNKSPLKQRVINFSNNTDVIDVVGWALLILLSSLSLSNSHIWCLRSDNKAQSARDETIQPPINQQKQKLHRGECAIAAVVVLISFWLSVVGI